MLAPHACLYNYIHAISTKNPVSKFFLSRTGFLNLFQVSGLDGCCLSSVAMLGRFDLTSSCLRFTISPFAEESSDLARRSSLARSRALSSRLAIELMKFSLHCAILDLISSDPRSAFREEQVRKTLY